MVVIEDHCCDCAVPGYPCRGNSCSRRHVEVHYCDRCGFEIPEREIHKDGDKEYCEDCYEEINEE